MGGRLDVSNGVNFRIERSVEHGVVTQKRTLWLHVGPAKTGTTTIQRAFHTGRAFLETHGATYPRRPANPYNKIGFAHHFLAHALAAGDDDFATAFKETLTEQHDVILSSEAFMRGGRDGLSRFARIFGDAYLIRPVFYARDPVSHSNSMAQQKIKAGQKSYDELAAKPPVIPLRKLIETLNAVFGAEAVILRKFAPSAFRRGDLVTDFCHAIGREAAAQGLETVRKNDSISLEAAFRIEAHRKATGDRAFIKAHDPRFAVAGEKFTLPPAALETVRTRTRNDLSWLRATYGIDLAS